MNIVLLSSVKAGNLSMLLWLVFMASNSCQWLRTIASDLRVAGSRYALGPYTPVDPPTLWPPYFRALIFLYSHSHIDRFLAYTELSYGKSGTETATSLAVYTHRFSERVSPKSYNPSTRNMDRSIALVSK